MRLACILLCLIMIGVAFAEPLKLLSIEPLNDSIVTNAKPVIKAVFNKPLIIDYTYNILGEGVTSYSNDTKTLYFFPISPLPSGDYVINLTGVKDVQGLSLEENVTSTFHLYSNYVPGLIYSLSNPRVINATRYFHFRNNGTQSTVLNIDMALIQDRLPGSYAQITGYSVEPQSINNDVYGNMRATLSLTVNPGEARDLIINYTLLLFSTDWFSYANISNIKTSVINDYSTTSWENLQADDYRIESLSGSLANTSDNDFTKAFRVYEWVRNNVVYDDLKTHPNDAVSVLINLTGVCQGYATLYAALARSIGLPTRYIFGYAMSNDTGTDTSGHAWNEVYINPIGWLIVDSTWGKSVNDWFLNTESTHTFVLNTPGWPLANTDWINWTSYESYEYSPYTINYTITNYKDLWNDSVINLYNAVSSLDFKKKILDYPFYNGTFEINKTNGYYYYTRVYPNLTSLGSDYLKIQNDDYTEIPRRVYKEIIDLFTSLLNSYYNELSIKFDECSKIRACNNFTNYVDELTQFTLGDLFNMVNNSLINASLMLNNSDFPGVSNELSNVTALLERSINWNRISLLYEYLTNIEWYSAPPVNYSNDFINDLPNISDEELTLPVLIISWIIIFIILIFPAVTWLACLVRGGKTHSRLYWLTVILLLNFIGGILYWIKEH